MPDLMSKGGVVLDTPQNRDVIPVFSVPTNDLDLGEDRPTRYYEDYWFREHINGVLSPTKPQDKVAIGALNTVYDELLYVNGKIHSTGIILGPAVSIYVDSNGNLVLNDSISGPQKLSDLLGSISYPSAGIVVSTGSAWGTSIVDNSSNWNTAYGWGNHAGLYEPVISKSTGYARWNGSAWSFLNETYSLSSHNHSGVYQPSNSNLNSLAGLSYVSTSFVKMTGANTFALDTNTYSLSTHNHSGVYQPAATNLSSLAGLSYTALAFVKMSAAGTFTLDTTTYLSSIPADVVRTGQVNTYGDFAQTFKDNIIRINNPADTFYYTLTAGAIAANRELNLPVITGSDTIAVLGLAQTFTTAQTFRAANSVRVEAATTQDAIVLAGRAGGSSSYAVTLIPSTLGGNRTITLPDNTTTMCGTDITQTLTNKTINATNNTITDTSQAAGDLLKNNGTKFVRMARGSALQVLRVNSGGTDLEWAAASSGTTPVSSPILFWDSGNTYYNAYASGDKAAGRFYYGTTDPTNSTRLNYDGFIYATGFRAGGTSNTYSDLTTNFMQIVVGGNARVLFDPTVADGGSAIAHILNTSNTLTTTAKLLSVRNNGLERFSVDQAGNINIPTGAEYRINGVPISGGSDTNNITFVLAAGVDATTGTNKTNVITMPRAGTITRCTIYAKTGPTGAALICDINVNGTTIWSTQGNRIQIAAGSQSGVQTSFNTTSLVQGDLITIDIDQIGSSVAGKDITVILTIS